MGPLPTNKARPLPTVSVLTTHREVYRLSAVSDICDYRTYRLGTEVDGMTSKLGLGSVLTVAQLELYLRGGELCQVKGAEPALRVILGRSRARISLLSCPLFLDPSRVF